MVCALFSSGSNSINNIVCLFVCLSSCFLFEANFWIWLLQLRFEKCTSFYSSALAWSLDIAEGDFRDCVKNCILECKKLVRELEVIKLCTETSEQTRQTTLMTDNTELRQNTDNKVRFSATLQVWVPVLHALHDVAKWAVNIFTATLSKNTK